MSSREVLIARAEHAIAHPEDTPISPVLILELLLEVIKALDYTYEAIGKYSKVAVYETPAEAYSRGAENEAVHIFDRMAEEEGEPT
jgi:hypothetical protein